MDLSKFKEELEEINRRLEASGLHPVWVKVTVPSARVKTPRVEFDTIPLLRGHIENGRFVKDFSILDEEPNLEEWGGS